MGCRFWIGPKLILLAFHSVKLHFCYSRLYYLLLVGRCWWPADCTSAQRTVYAQDSSWILGELIKKSGSTTALFGEFQFAYLAFVIGQVGGRVMN